jgi:transposase
MLETIYVGIDPAAESFTATFLHAPGRSSTAPSPFENTEAGITALEHWLREAGIQSEQIHFCIENTGVYSETLCYQLHEKGFTLSLLDPRTVWKAFGDGQPKNDPLDSQRIAEFGFRYTDKLRIWQPQEIIVEQIRVILSTREQLVQQKTATKNARSTLARKIIQTPAANRALEATRANLEAQVEQLEEELKRLIRSHPTIMQGVSLLMSAPGVSWLLSGHFAVMTRGFTEIPSYRMMAQYLGISPNEHTSGTSVRKRDKSRRYGPATTRKLLHLAARSLRTHDSGTRRYFLEKTALGKPKRLVLNNIANKLLKKLCAMLESKTPYIRGHRSVNPRYLALA